MSVVPLVSCLLCGARVFLNSLLLSSTFFALRCSSSLVARSAGGDLHYHGAGLSAGRGSDVNGSGIIDVERFANGSLVYCGCNLDIVAAWHKLATKTQPFSLP